MNARQRKIVLALHNLWKQHGEAPSTSQLKQATGVSEMTIYEEIPAFGEVRYGAVQASPRLQRWISVYRSFTDPEGGEPVAENQGAGMIRTTKDGRTIYNGRHYTRFRRAIWNRCEGVCECCGREMVFNWEDLTRGFHVHHFNGRGGGKRDDVDSKVKGICSPCHRKEHGQ